jgi:hypothetical protein
LVLNGNRRIDFLKQKQCNYVDIKTVETVRLEGFVISSHPLLKPWAMDAFPIGNRRKNWRRQITVPARRYLNREIAVESYRSFGAYTSHRSKFY